MGAALLVVAALAGPDAGRGGCALGAARTAAAGRARRTLVSGEELDDLLANTAEVGAQLDERLAGLAGQWMAAVADEADMLDIAASCIDDIDMSDGVLVLALQGTAPDFEQWPSIIEADNA